MRALIIGGGIGGLAAGLALRGAGLDVAVFERAPEFRAVGAGLTLWANAVKSLDALGVGAELRQESLQGEQGGIHTWQGRTLSEISPRELERLTGAPSVAVHRAELIDLLAGALGRERVRLNRECLDFLQNDAGVIARFADGSVEHGDLLIGADGLRSVIRARLFGDAPPKYAGYVAWRGVLPFDISRVKIGEYLGRGQRFGLVPLRGGRLYWFATATMPLNSPPAADGERARLLRRFAGWCAPIPHVIRQTDPAAILRNEICDRDPIDRWGEGRVTLLGDAAHPMTPNLGQGACQTIEDAVELGRHLAGVREPSAISGALRNYEARRVPRTRRIVLLSRRYGRMAQARSGLGAWLRDRFLSSTPPRMQMRQMAGIVNGWE